MIIVVFIGVCNSSVFLIGVYKRNVSDMATVLLDVVRKFSEKHQTSDLALIQIVIFDSHMCDGFARALQSAVKNNQSFWGRTKRKLTESENS